VLNWKEIIVGLTSKVCYDRNLSIGNTVGLAGISVWRFLECVSAPEMVALRLVPHKMGPDHFRLGPILPRDFSRKIASGTGELWETILHGRWVSWRLGNYFFYRAAESNLMHYLNPANINIAVPRTAFYQNGVTLKNGAPLGGVAMVTSQPPEFFERTKVLVNAFAPPHGTN
jgi:hypothetical protein